MDLLEIPRLIDISAVRTDATVEEIYKIIELVKEHNFLCAFSMPCFTEILVKELENSPNTIVGGVVGFPSGADLTAIKVATAKELVSIGVDEIDMVINVGQLKSGDYSKVQDDIKAVIDASNGLPVKSILEICYLTDDEIAKGSELAVEAGVSYVKTGTGWGNKPTTVDTIKLIKKTIGDSAFIKAAGGVRTLDTMLEMIDAGCSRFGIGLGSAVSILDEAYLRMGKDSIKNEFSTINVAQMQSY